MEDIITNNEVTEVETEATEAIAEVGSSHTGLKVVGGLALIGGLAFAGYKGVKALIAKRKTKKENADDIDTEEVEVVEATPVEDK